MNFNIKSAVEAKEGGKFLSAGIKEATFKGIEFSTVKSQKSGEDFDTMELKLDIEEYGEYSQKFFEPKSNERPQMQWGVSPSPLDHFLITVREILEALDPQIIADIDAGKVELSGDFKAFVKKVKELAEPHIGAKVQIKLLPQNNGFVSMPSFPARITKNGELGISTRIIGHDLTLSTRELDKIKAAQDAKPTDMSAKLDVKSTLESVADDLGKGGSEDEDDDLPF